MTKYAWTITVSNDNLCGEMVGRVGPKTATLTDSEIRKGERFRLKDDDGVVYMYGYIAGDYDGFEPLDECGAAFGCTSIEYKNKDGDWEPL